MLVQIITPEKIEWKAEADSVTLPSIGGQITILPGHIDLVSALEAGEMIVKIEKKELSFFISEGVLLIRHNEVTIMADLATRAVDLTQARVEEAENAAIKAREEKVDEVEFATIEANLRRELAKEKIMEKYGRRIKRVGN